jgi:hypothetical protein
MKAKYLVLSGLLFCTMAVAQTSRLTDIGDVGIGASNPKSFLQMGQYTLNNITRLSFPGTYNFEVFNLGQQGNGNPYMEFVNHTAVAYSYGVKVGANADAYGPGLYITTAPVTREYTTLAYQNNPAFFVNISNCVGIGTNNPAGYRLAVAGNMIAEKVKVKLQATWPDYVFDASYNLMPLAKLEEYIKTNNHLPEIPKESQVKKDGIDVEEMNTKLLQKIEELTLYIINQQKEINELSKRLNSIDHK